MSELVTFECGACGSTYTGRPHELIRLGWVSHHFKAEGMRRPNGEFLMCRECEGEYDRRRKIRARLNDLKAA